MFAVIIVPGVYEPRAAHMGPFIFLLLELRILASELLFLFPGRDFLIIAFPPASNPARGFANHQVDLPCCPHVGCSSFGFELISFTPEHSITYYMTPVRSFCLLNSFVILKQCCIINVKKLLFLGSPVWLFPSRQRFCETLCLLHHTSSKCK